MQPISVIIDFEQDLFQLLILEMHWNIVIVEVVELILIIVVSIDTDTTSNTIEDDHVEGQDDQYHVLNVFRQHSYMSIVLFE